MILAQPAAGTARARLRQPGRASVLVAVLLGLFLMHGSPAAAAGGCHGAMPDTDTTVLHSAPARTAAHRDTMRPAPAMTAAHPAKARPATAPTAGHPAGHATAAAEAAKAAPRMDEAVRGALCVATTPRSEIPPPLTASVLVFPAAVLLSWNRPGPGGTRRRGPPDGGRQLLLQVCVART
ncbi:hypothetical protein ACWGLF_32675 [Streptomyces puniciscabiei]